VDRARVCAVAGTSAVPSVVPESLPCLAAAKVRLRTTRANEVLRIDSTVIRLLDGTRAYLHTVIDNFSRRILAWRVTGTFAPANSLAVLVEASHGATPSETTPVVLAYA
jgi:putative transposase